LQELILVLLVKYLPLLEQEQLTSTDSGKSSFVKYRQDDMFGSLDLSIENNGCRLAGRYYTNDGVKRDLLDKKQGTARYSLGASLTKSGP
jgi:hypothetical protein